MSADSLKMLVVDDDPVILESIRLFIPSQWRLFSFFPDLTLMATQPVEESITEHHVAEVDAAFVDIHLSQDMEKTEGLEVIQGLRKQNPHLEIVAISGDLNYQLMEAALKAGASRFLAKPLSPEEVQLTLEKIEALILLRQATQRKRSQANWVGQSSTSQELRKRIANLSQESGPILIEGESGTGKEVVAELIHQLKPNQPMISVNVAAISESLFESEFFGHVKGAFTGADQNKMGLAEAAHGGKLFLDEIEALSLPMQVKLLRFLENGEIRRVGSQKSLTVKTQVIAATNKNLESLVAEGQFREDLLWRLNGKKILIPPLRLRKEDIPELATHFLKMDKIRKKELSPEAIKSLRSYHWPGNVRELKRVCEQLLADSPLPVIREADVTRCLPATAHSPTGANQILNFNQGLQALLNQFEAEVIQKCLEKTEDIDVAAKTLQISRSNMYKKIKDYEIRWRPL